ncbi:Rha family transcriptional regulator [Shewanella algae]|uniref:Rha family transcriptional regulator n=1 Tax=Shewanella algae TaxID=38313 RepID=UPI001AAE88E9|nr:Rha family transcriptional regulator [Shewanella algae]MBO2587198.1 Rha family transcriptional regulator [Shewanella algae]
MDTSYLDNLNRQQTEYLLPCREIAELTGKRHDHVCRDIRNMLEQLNVEQKPFLDFDNSGANRRTVAFFRLPRRDIRNMLE